jgi:hypothetical protein
MHIHGMPMSGMCIKLTVVLYYANTIQDVLHYGAIIVSIWWDMRHYVFTSAL